MNTATASQRGRQAEDRALRFLQQHKLTLIERNYHSASGEIDLIMRDNDILVFVEVRARTGNHFMETIETIGPKKVQRLIRTAEHYLSKSKISTLCRFDVVAISGALDTARIDWIKNAFEA